MTEQMQDNVATSGNQAAQIEMKMQLEGQLKAGASWFYWVGALSLINSILFISGSTMGFIFGLGITQVFDAIGGELSEEIGSKAKIFALAFNCLIAGVYGVLGVFSHKRYTAVFIIGLVFYGLDGLLCLLAQDWFSVAFHAFAGFSIFKGMQAGMQLNRLEAVPAQPAANGN